MLKKRNSTEYLANIIKDNYQHFVTADLPIKKKHRQKIRLTLDTKEDLKVISFFLKEIKHKNKIFSYTIDDLINFFRKNKKILRINKNIKQKKLPKQYSTEILWNKFIR